LLGANISALILFSLGFLIRDVERFCQWLHECHYSINLYLCIKVVRIQIGLFAEFKPLQGVQTAQPYSRSINLGNLLSDAGAKPEKVCAWRLNCNTVHNWAKAKTDLAVLVIYFIHPGQF
jgi:hypothetical protein